MVPRFCSSAPHSKIHSCSSFVISKAVKPDPACLSCEGHSSWVGADVRDEIAKLLHPPRTLHAPHSLRPVCHHKWLSRFLAAVAASLSSELENEGGAGVRVPKRRLQELRSGACKRQRCSFATKLSRHCFGCAKLQLQGLKLNC